MTAISAAGGLAAIARRSGQVDDPAGHLAAVSSGHQRDGCAADTVVAAGLRQIETVACAPGELGGELCLTLGAVAGAPPRPVIARPLSMMRVMRLDRPNICSRYATAIAELPMPAQQSAAPGRHIDDLGGKFAAGGRR